jgi:glycosyltransferase involved in cell wall biosynthesis
MPGARVVAARDAEQARASLPSDLDIVHFHGWHPAEAPFPHLKTAHGNGDPATYRHGNWSFVSRDHAQRHGRASFVYNAVDLAEVEVSASPSDRYLFLARINRPGKNLSGAMRLARRHGLALDIAGGHRADLLLRSQVRREGAFFLSLDPRFRFHGVVGGAAKARLIANARALLSPISWEEPFGLSVIEALAAGVPVITTKRGAMPEIVTEDVGFLCESDEDFARAFAEIGSINRARCRTHVEERFTVARMADGYLELYRRILDGEALP